jgi:hypothetical protein
MTTPTVKSYSFFGPVDIEVRLDKIRRSPRFAKVPSRSELLRLFVEEGLAKLETDPSAATTTDGNP